MKVRFSGPATALALTLGLTLGVTSASWLGTGAARGSAAADASAVAVTELPTLPAGTALHQLGASAGTVVAEIQGPVDPGSVRRPDVFLQAPLDAAADDGAAWQPSTYAGAPLTTMARLLPFYSHGTFLVGSAGCEPAQVDRPSGEQAVPGCAVQLGHGGALVQTRIPGQSTLSTFDAGGHVVRESDALVGLDGDTAWDIAGTPSAPVLQGFTATSTTPPVPLPAECGAAGRPAVLDALGRWALLSCSGGHYVADTTGVLRPMPLESDWRLGDGFLYRATASGVDVRSFDAARSTTSVTLPTAPTEWLAADDAAPDLVRAAGDASSAVSSIERLDVSPAAPETPADDTVAPVVDALDGPGPATARDSGTMTFSWSGHDDRDGAHVTYETQVRAPGETAWREQAPMTVATGAGFDTAIPGGDNFCLRVRAVDAVGNASGWSTRCTFIDEDPPFTTARNTFRPPSGPAPMHESLGFISSDDSGLALTHDFEMRSAAWGHGFGAWRTTASRQASPSANVRIPAGAEVCVRSRSRDLVGHVGQWTVDSECAEAPYDDRRMTSHGARRVVDRAAYDHTATVLRGRESLTIAHATGRVVLLRTNLPADGCPAVWWGGRRLRGSCSFWRHHHGYAWLMIDAAHERRGTIRIRAPWWHRTMRVDAVATWMRD